MNPAIKNSFNIKFTLFKYLFPVVVLWTIFVVFVISPLLHQIPNEFVSKLLHIIPHLLGVTVIYGLCNMEGHVTFNENGIHIRYKGKYVHRIRKTLFIKADHIRFFKFYISANSGIFVVALKNKKRYRYYFDKEKYNEEFNEDDFKKSLEFYFPEIKIRSKWK